MSITINPTMALPTKPVSQNMAPKVNFAEMLEKMGSNDPHLEVLNMQKKITEGKQLGFQELLLYQIKVSQLGLRTELLSKVCEGMLSTAKRLQNQQ